ncbi:MAG: ERAP1-like C-terminal domain-containing protein, partial [Thermoplasmata archaeon]|nr:ERAP1-like C-terminal domain-containing protein [Candidatus Sysuiplasma jiujiangense]
DASGMRIDTIMKAWITKPGYPVISVKSDKKGVTLEQRRFTFKESASEDRWPIPITYKSTGGEGRILFDRKSIHIAVGDPSDFLINESRSGYFRVEYDDDIYSSIYKKVRKMNPHARWGIISDLFAFLAAGRISEKLYFSFADLLSEDDNYLVVNEIHSQLKTLCTLLPGPNPVSARYNKFCHLHLERIGIEGRGNEDRSLTVLRENLCDGLVMTDDKFAADLSQRFSGWNNLKPELKQAVAVAYARTYGASGLNKLIRALKDSKTDQDATKITISLASFRDESAVMKALELSFTGDLNIGHVPYVIISCSRNPDARRVLWKWFRSNDGKLIQAYSGTGLIAPMIEYIISGCGIVDPEDVRQYFAQKSIAEATRAARKGLEQLDINLSLIKKLADIGNAA